MPGKLLLKTKVLELFRDFTILFSFLKNLFIFFILFYSIKRPKNISKHFQQIGQ